MSLGDTYIAHSVVPTLQNISHIVCMFSYYIDGIVSLTAQQQDVNMLRNRCRDALEDGTYKRCRITASSKGNHGLSRIYYISSEASKASKLRIHNRNWLCRFMKVNKHFICKQDPGYTVAARGMEILMDNVISCIVKLFRFLRILFYVLKLSCPWSLYGCIGTDQLLRDVKNFFHDSVYMFYHAGQWSNKFYFFILYPFNHFSSDFFNYSQYCFSVYIDLF